LFLSLCLIDGVTLFSSLSLLLVAINDFSGRSSSASNSYDRCYCGEGWAMVTAVVVVVAGGGERLFDLGWISMPASSTPRSDDPARH
jgi:hypothetical protein